MGNTIFHRELVGHPSRPPGCWGEPEKQRYEDSSPTPPSNCRVIKPAPLNRPVAEGFGVWIREGTGGREVTLQKTEPIKYPKQVQDVSKISPVGVGVGGWWRDRAEILFCFPWKFMRQNLRNFSQYTQGDGCFHFRASLMRQVMWNTVAVKRNRRMCMPRCSGMLCVKTFVASSPETRDNSQKLNLEMEESLSRTRLKILPYL